MNQKVNIISEELAKCYVSFGREVPPRSKLDAQAELMAEELKFSSDHLARCFEISRREKPFPVVADLYKAFREQVLPDLPTQPQKQLLPPSKAATANANQYFRANCIRYGFELPDFTPEEKSEARRWCAGIEHRRKTMNSIDFDRWHDYIGEQDIDERARAVSRGEANVSNLFGGGR